MNPVEILAPAGELEQLKAAVWFGADAVYLAAKSFGMRSAPANFSFEELKLGCDFAHSKGVKVYQTVNVLLTNSEVKDLEQFLIDSKNAGVDAFIVADIGVMQLAKRVCPDVEIHISVQAGVVNYLTANELYKLGAKRVVLARELTLKEIREIKQNIPEDLEIESFVHGAICMSFSGRCLISQYFVQRDANHGECAQPCRWEYEIRDVRAKTDPNRENNSLVIVEESTLENFENGEVVSEGSYILNSKDLNLINHISELIDSGIYSLKIEGRAKSSFYVASVVRCYKAAVMFLKSNPNSELPSWILEEIEKISHREYTTGFYFADSSIDGKYNALNAPTSLLEKGYKQEFAPALVKLEDGWHQRGKVELNEVLDALTPLNGDGIIAPPIQVKLTKIIDSKTKTAQSSTPHADQLLILEITDLDGFAVDFEVGTFLRKSL